MVQLTVRLPDDLHTKIKVIAAYEDISINAMVVESFQKRIELWEKENGKLPEPSGRGA